MKLANILITLAFLSLFSASVLAQDNPFPNESEGYEFFGKGGLRTFRFGESKREDVQRIFGSTCEKTPCDYDSKFFIRFDYLNLDSCMTTKLVTDRLVCPLDKYIGTIEKISLFPKREIQFDRIATAKFPAHSGGGIYPKDGSKPTLYESIKDEHGLSYSFRRETSATVSPAPPFLEGVLYSVEYTLSDDQINTIFKGPYKSQ